MGGLGGPSSLKQVPLSRGRPLVRMPLLTCLGRNLTPLLASPSSPEHMTGDEDSSEDEVYTDSFTSHTTASGSTTADPLTSSASVLEDNSSVQPLNVSPTESQFTSEMPYVGSTQSDQTSDSVFIQQPSSLDSSSSQNSITISPVPPAPRRSARSTKGAPPVQFGKGYTHSTIISEVAKPTMYKQILYVPCYQAD